MTKKKLKNGIILEWKSFTDTPLPQNRLDFLKNAPKVEILALLAYVNNQLSPRISVKFDYSIATQKRILEYMLRLEDREDFKNIFYSKLIGDNILFNRVSNLFAITEILNSDLPTQRANGKIYSTDLEGFLKYYLCVNTHTVAIRNQSIKVDNDLENLNASVLAYNEYFINVDPIYTLYRGRKLFDAILNSKYKDAFLTYIKRISHGSESEYLQKVAKLYFSDHDSTENEEYRMGFRLLEPDQLLYKLSTRESPIEERYELEALHVRKSPFYRVDELFYVLLDDIMLLEKTCDLFSWDFLFEELLSDIPKDERKAVVTDFRSFFGLFFESYLRGLIEYSFHFLKHPKTRMFEDLLKDGIEIGDIYLRQNKKILLGEVKSSSIASKPKYSASAIDLYNENKNQFFKDHGLNQLVTNLERLCNTPHLYDEKVIIGKRYKVYPIIITNEKSLISAIMPQIFNEQFDKAFDRSRFPHLDIKKLAIVHISELETLQEALHRRTTCLFKLLDKHFASLPVVTRISISFFNLNLPHRKGMGELIFGNSDQEIVPM